MEPKTITLTDPITDSKGDVLTELTIKQPLGKHMRRLPVGAMTLGTLLDLATESSGIPPSVIDQLSAVDAMAVGDAVGDFLGGGPGAKPSP